VSPRRRDCMREWWDRMSEWLRALRADNPLVFPTADSGLCCSCWYSSWRTRRGWCGARCAAHGVPMRPRPAAATRGARRGVVRPRRRLGRGRGYGSPRPSSWPSSRWRSASTDRASCSITRARRPPSAPGTRAMAPADRERLRGLVRTLYLHAFGGRPAGPGRVPALARRRRGALACARGLSWLAAAILAALAVGATMLGAAGRGTRTRSPPLHLPGRSERGQRVGRGAGSVGRAGGRYRRPALSLGDDRREASSP
jgi:hypothetical protein